ncbi:cell division ATP-binding protein FtsE [Chitinispirillales bacterium ANBcel5]|uniref:cell division ATP-binding protein FtsE n=1 Tax=Cellulosispirillum alkaliphilum TaxID=3039283 RepID=UPI002A57D967|nr:cell division ATP-binding protein FtsE [Chitinispirillales bacterium ANBcel5]
MIQFSHVTKHFDDRYPALNDLSFFIDKGEFVFLTGASGAGKTTLLKHIYMEELPSSGQVLVCGYDSKSIKSKNLPYLRRKLGIVFQDFRLLHDRNVFENVAFALRVTGKSERDVKRKVFEVLSRTGLSHKCSNFPNQLSGGEQQRVCIARAIVNEPWVLLADEPTGNLDYAVSKDIFELLQIINSWGTTVIMSTHDLQLIKPYHYRLIELSYGKLTKGADSTLKPKFKGATL